MTVPVDDSQTAHALQQALTFMLGTETYAVDVLRVREIKVWSRVTPIPLSSSHVLGVLNLRGEIVPVVDLRRLLALPPAEFGPQTVIIVISFSGDDERSRSVGVVVDRVSEVVDARSTDLRPAPEIGPSGTASLLGILALSDALVQWLDIDRLLGSELLPATAPSLQAPAAGGAAPAH